MTTKCFNELFFLQGIKSVYDDLEFFVTEQDRLWVRKFVYEETVKDSHGGGRKSSYVTGHPTYKKMMKWDTVTHHKYKTFLAFWNVEYCVETWKKWRLRFVRNNDVTNTLFLTCMKELQAGNILYSKEKGQLKFVSNFLVWVYIPKVLFTQLLLTVT